jgi:hypothetical protein
MVATRKDLEFAKNHKISRNRMESVMAIFEKAINFKSSGLSFNDLMEKVNYEVPNF